MAGTVCKFKTLIFNVVRRDWKYLQPSSPTSMSGVGPIPSIIRNRTPNHSAAAKTSNVLKKVPEQ